MVCVQPARRARSAELQSAVSQVFNLLTAAREQRSADYKSAIQQIKNLRYANRFIPVKSWTNEPSFHKPFSTRRFEAKLRCTHTENAGVAT